MFRFCFLAFLLAAFGTAVAEESAVPLPLEEAESAALAAETDGQLSLSYDPESEAERRFYIHAGFINAYPRLKSETLIDAYNIAMRAIAPGFDDVMIVSDLRDAGLLWQPQIGFGYKLNDKWSFAAQAGVAWGTVRTVDDDMSIFLVPLHTDFSITRGAWFFGAGFDYFPFGMMEQRKYEGVWDRIKGSRPFIGGSMTVTKAWFESKIKFGFPVLPNVAIKLEDDWFITSFNFHLGLDVPITRHGGLSINYGRNLFLEEEEDFEGTALSVEWKHFIKPTRKQL